MKTLCTLAFILLLSYSNTYAQEEDLMGFEINIDQDYFADFLRESPKEDNNYATALRLGFYGQYANSIYLGLPYVREIVDAFLYDNILYNVGFNEERRSHNFVFTINGFSPSHISDQIPLWDTFAMNGYRLADDRPFSSFTGFRATRRIEGYKVIPHAARRLDMALTTSITFGFTNIGWVQGVDNLFGANRPSAIFWDRDETKPFPTGLYNTKIIPVFMYSVSGEAVIWRPLKKVLFQVRPELNIGYYTNVGVGIDFGKVMNVERHIDNLSFTDPTNPGLLVINNEDLAFSVVGGVMARAVIYNAHLQGWLSSRKDEYNSVDNVKRILFEAYAGIKLQFYKRLEVSFSVTQRSAEFDAPFLRRPMWGTFGLKYLLGTEGEGCYD